jgi:hypothetical protein
MNIRHLTNLYDRLTPLERLPLVIAAGARGDQAEQERLSGSAPRERFEVPNYYGLAQALLQAGDFHLMTLLDLAANFWQWWGLWMLYTVCSEQANGTDQCPGAKTKAEKARQTRAGGIACYYATRFVAHVEGWKQFCSDLHLDPEVQLNFMPGWDTITRTFEHARQLAFSHEEAIGFVLSENVPVEGNDSLERGPVPVENATELAEAWHKILEKLEQES